MKKFRLVEIAKQRAMDARRDTKAAEGWRSEFELVTALGHGWVDASDALPWADLYGQLRYMVYSPSYGGEIFRCKFELGGVGRSFHESGDTSRWVRAVDGVGVGGVTYWRLAKDGEIEGVVRDSQLPPPGTISENFALAELKRWWRVYLNGGFGV